jgi:serine/threonine protein kinase
MWRYPFSYHFKNKLGEGGYGEVFETFRPRFHFSGDYIPICTKKIDLSAEDIITHQRKKQKAIKEAQLLKSFYHPNIVKYLDDYQKGKSFFIVMEFVKGGNLRKFIEKYKNDEKIIPEDLLIFIFSQLISALHYCFDQKIIHGDIKSENILITDSNIVKLADFGISKILPSQEYECDPTVSTA